MSYIIVGLGNPGEEYAETRHNTGRMALQAVFKEFGEGELEYNKKVNALMGEGTIGKQKVTFVAPETFMNNSGKAVAALVKNVKAADKLVVIYDDFSLPLGRVKISYNRSSGGHNGLESVIKAVKTEAFTRMRVGVAPSNAKGEAKVPHGDDAVQKFILGKYKEPEEKELKKVFKNVVQGVQLLVTESREKAMSVTNAA